MKLRGVHLDESGPLSRFWVVLVWLAGGLVFALIGLGVGLKLWAPKVVAEYQLAVAGTPSNTLVFAAGGELLATLSGAEDRHWVPLARINPYIQKAAVAIEDRRFFAHRGMDPVRIAGAVWADLRARSFDQGASTITQQLVKLSLLSSERTLTRKVKELFMALALEQELPKLTLLESYLNKVYFGYGMYGVETAAHGYFGKSAEALTLNEAAFLAALIKKPEGYLQITGPDPAPDSPELPLQRMESLVRRQKLVVEQMHKLGWISDEDFDESGKSKLRVLRPRTELGTAPYFVQQVLKELKEILAFARISGGGYRVYTTLDLRQQKIAESLVDRVARENKDASEAALVALEPRTGYVRALVGGVDFARSQFNRATLAMRQPGSAFKPILYAAALEHGFSPIAVFHDEPVRFVWSGGRKDFKRTLTIGASSEAVAPGSASPPSGSTQPGGVPPNTPASSDLATPEGEQVYEPRNYDGKYGLPAIRAAAKAEGQEEEPDRRMTLGRALELSSNVIAVQLLDQLGMGPLVSLASRYNLTIKPEMGLCVALGCSETTLLTLTAAYGSFANNGVRVAPVLIRSVTNAAGEPLYIHAPPQAEQVVSEGTAFQIRQMLMGVLERGTGQRARLGRPAGGKTGTNDGPRDTWFVGFVPELVAGVWIGNDDNRVMPSEVGGRTTARIWGEYMRAVLPDSHTDFPDPSIEYVGQRVCNLNGRIAQPGCPDVETYYFPANEVPPQIFSADDEGSGFGIAANRAAQDRNTGQRAAPGASPAATPPGSAAAQFTSTPPASAQRAVPPPLRQLAQPPVSQPAPVQPLPIQPTAKPVPISQRFRDAFTPGPAPRALPPE